MHLFDVSTGTTHRLPRLIVLGAAAGIAVIGTLIAVTGGIPFYQLLKEHEDEHFIFEIESVANTLEQYLVRITDIASQITSRTKAREELEAYNNGLVGLEELQQFSLPILNDALQLNSHLVGITRFDGLGYPVIQAGAALPLYDFSLGDIVASEPKLLGPYAIGDGHSTIVIAPIRDRQNNVVGMDAVAFDFDELQADLREFSESDPIRKVFLSRKVENRLDILFEYPPNKEASSDRLDQIVLIRSIFADAPLNQPRLLQPDLPSEVGGATAYYLFSQTGWLLTFHDDLTTLYNPIHRVFSKYVLMLLSIIAIGSLVTYGLLRPLADKVISLTKNLHAEVSDRQNAEKALAKRMIQQEAVAAFGQFCLSDARIQELLDHAVKVTADTLRVEYCKVLELVPARNVVVLRSGVGWHDGLVGVAEVPLDRNSQAGYTLISKEPVAVEDLATEERFSGPQLLLDHQVRSGISVIIDPEDPWGVFGAHSIRKRVFTKDDINFVQAVANCVAEAIERKKAEDASKSAEARFRALYDDNPAIFITVSADFRIESINQFGAEQLGYHAEEIIGQHIEKIAHNDDGTLLVNNLKRCLAENQTIHRWELRKKRRDESTMWVRDTARVVVNDDGDMSVLIVCEDVSETHALSEKLTYEASHDSLTGLVNRRDFENRLNRMIHTAHNNEVEHVLCYMDLDQFKVINDSCGHVAGDQLLCQIAKLLQEGLRKGDTVARLGGDEFGLLLQHCSVDRGEIIANELRSKIEEFRFTWGRGTFCIGISVGLVQIAASSGTITNLLRNADSACYAAKDAGRNRVHVYQEGDAELAKRHGEMRWVARINEGLEQNRFRLFAQPIRPIQEAVKDEIHHELLIRLQDTDNVMIPPGAFLPAAERYNLATRIDKWVVKTFLDYVAGYPGLLAELGTCSINLSGQSLADSEFLTYVLDMLNESSIDADRICFEITETAAISNLTAALQFIEGVTEYGCRFSLDDFGSGLSSFAYLKTLPVDYLKIDGIFVKDIVDDPADFAMVKSIHDIGKSLGKTTIAEFVENDEIKQALVRIGVDFAQGYGIGMPMPIDDFESVVPQYANATLRRLHNQ